MLKVFLKNRDYILVVRDLQETFRNEFQTLLEAQNPYTFFTEVVYTTYRAKYLSRWLSQFFFSQFSGEEMYHAKGDLKTLDDLTEKVFHFEEKNVNDTWVISGVIDFWPLVNWLEDLAYNSSNKKLSKHFSLVSQVLCWLPDFTAQFLTKGLNLQTGLDIPTMYFATSKNADENGHSDFSVTLERLTDFSAITMVKDF